MEESSSSQMMMRGEKSERSVFVGNIPYEATEEKLKEIFGEVGPVVSFKLVYDRENGRPRGYGFCEYYDPETASSAMRNLNGHEIGGRALRVDSASSERNSDRIQDLEGNDNDQAMDPDKAPEAISKAVASLPPEQMFELMKVMKNCIQNNPQEARNMLLQNPQLAYALLQAQVVMRIVDPEMALKMLHKPQHPSMNLNSRGEQMGGRPMGGVGLSPPPPPSSSSSMMMPQVVPSPATSAATAPSMVPHPATMHQQHQQQQQQQSGFNAMRSSADPVMDYNQSYGLDPHHQSSAPFGDLDRDMGGGGPGGHSRYGRDPRSRGDPRNSLDGSSGGRFDPRGSSSSSMGQRQQQQQQLAPSGLGGALASADPAHSDLIRQVLQLTDEQIATLPAEQRLSIMELKKQIHQVPL